MHKRSICIFLALILLLSLLSGCGDTPALKNPASGKEETSAPETEPTTPATVPADGDPEDVTCKGSYTADSINDTVIASFSDKKLTNAALQVFYQLEVNNWRQETRRDAVPDWNKPLDTQPCPIDDSVNSWQQYFLKRALTTWHTVQAMEIHAERMGIPTEEAYQPNLDNHAEYLTGMPATRWLYGYNKSYSPNEVHQAYLDGIPDMLQQLAGDRGFGSASALAEAMGTTRSVLEEAVRLYNFGYMYFTTLGYDLEPEQGHVESLAGTKDGGKYVSIRHILFQPTEGVEGTPLEATEDVPAEEPKWAACRESAENLLVHYQKELKDNSYNALKTTEEAIFAELANEFSQDAGTRNDGGSYRDIRQGQLIDALDSWCFDPARQYGDVTTIQTELGYHVLFFCSSRDIWYAEAEDKATVSLQKDLIKEIRQYYPMEVTYGDILLAEAADTLSGSDVLYPDIGHERFPVVPLYLQQDYPTTKYGAFKITSHGCGITTLAMLASYMADDDMMPPRMCEAYPNYVYKTGTDGRLFVTAPAEMGFYLRQQTYDWRDAYAALEEGYIVVVVQQKGFWTRGGHYLVLEKLNEDGRIQVRDSNIYNYGRLHDHQIDSFEWSTVTPKGMSYWIFEDKVVTIPACSRCGQEGSSLVLTDDYICEKCSPALIRRNTFLTAVGE